MPPLLFHDISITSYIGLNAHVKTKYKTDVIRMREGDEDRVGNWQDAIRTFDIGPALRNQADLNALISFYRARLGPTYAFKIVDPLDYICTFQYIGTGNDSQTIFPLVKRYTSGLSGDNRYTVRPITIPDYPIIVYWNGVEQGLEMYDVDYTTGIVYFLSPVPNGVGVTWSGTFQVPVSFVTNRMYASIEMYQKFGVDIVLQEMRAPVHENIIGESEPQDFDEVLFPAEYSDRSQSGPAFEIVIIAGSSGIEEHLPQFISPKISFNVSMDIRTVDEMELFLNFFHARRGKLIGFRAKDLTDYAVENELIAVGNGILTQFQLIKTYTDVAYGEVRKITKPAFPIQVKVGGIDISSTLVVDYTTGLIYFPSPPSGNITWTGEFHIPVRFNTDEMDVTLEGAEVQSWGNIELVEIPVDTPIVTIVAP